jgi:hypothetical protein
MIKDFKLFLEENQDSKFRVFCDMDGVLTNFDKGFQQLNDEGLGPEEYEQEHGKNKIWPLISDQGSAFWSNLEWMPDGKELWNYLQQYNPTILSSPSREYSSITGKMTWINSNLGITQRKPVTRNKDWDKDTRIILSSYKYLFVIPGTACILIDDTPSKIEKWTAAGGIGILHTDANSSINTLSGILRNI